MVAPRCDDSRWLDQAAIAAFAGASFARYSRSFVTPRYGAGHTFVARGKR
jgi:hypothetical protein